MIEQLSNTHLGDFLLHETISRRAIMVLYRATQVSLQRFAMVKVIDLKSAPLSEGTMSEDFLAFLRNVVALENLHLQPIYDYRMIDEQHLYVAGRYLPGTLQELLRTGALQTQRALEIALDILQAVGFVELNGLVHGSLAPANIYLDEAGSAFVDDLELAHVVKAARSLKQLEIVLGEPFYASVEQLELKPIDFRSDIYSVGAILYHMVTGTAPFSDGANSFEAVLARKLRNQVIPPGKFNQAIPAALEQVILRMLRADPSERFPDIAALQAALSQDMAAFSTGRKSLIGALKALVSQFGSPGIDLRRL